MSKLRFDKLFLLAIPLYLFIVTSCERPNSPDFKVNHNIRTPLLAEEKLTFLGADNALIDTTSSEFDSLFAVNQQSGVDSGLVSLSQEEDLSLGSFSDAVPVIESNPRLVNSQLGTISAQAGEQTEAEVGTFSPSFSGSGQASFLEVVGQNPPNDGQLLPANQNTVRIPLNMENFVSATIEDGAVEVEFQNNLGFNISNLEIQLYSNTDGAEEAVGSRITNNNIVRHGDTYTDHINFQEGEQLEVTLEAEVFIEWNQQNYQAVTDPSMTVNVRDDNLLVSKATSDIPQQELNPNTPDIEIGSSDFDYAALTGNAQNGSLNQLDIEVTNNTQLPLTNANATGTPTLALQNSEGEVLGTQKSLQVEGQPNAAQLESGETGTVRFDLSGDELTKNIHYELNLGTSGGDNLNINAADVVTIQSSTTELEVDEAKLSMDSEELETGNSIAVEEAEFRFTQPNHYVELEGGSLVIDSLVNQLGMGIENLTVTINDIFTPEGDTLKISFEGSSDGPAGSYRYKAIEANENDERQPVRIDLNGFRIKALNNQVEYKVSGQTEDSGSRAVIVRSSDDVGAKLQLQELEVKEAQGVVAEKRILLNDDDPSNGEDVLDVFNDQEAEVKTFNDLEELSNRIGETQFFNTSFDLLYDINLGVRARIYGIIVGINEEGKKVYLTPKDDSKFAVNNPQAIQGLEINGQSAQSSRIIKLPIETAQQMGDTYHGAIQFDREATNVDEFLSNFPTEIRFVGKALTNPSGEEGFVVTPIDFNSSIGFEIPIQFANTAGSQVLKDTVDVDLSDLPDEESDQALQSSAIRVKYENMLPFSLDLELKFLDEQGAVITTAPLPTENQVVVQAPEIDPQTRFANTPHKGELVINFTAEQAQKLHRTREIRLGGSFKTPSASGSHRVKIRKDDYFKYTLVGDFKIQTEVSSGN